MEWLLQGWDRRAGRGECRRAQTKRPGGHKEKKVASFSLESS